MSGAMTSNDDTYDDDDIQLPTAVPASPAQPDTGDADVSATAKLLIKLRDKVFQLYFTTKPGGSGIGLNLARHIALGHGGQLELRVTVPRGSVFVLTLPGVGITGGSHVALVAGV